MQPSATRDLIVGLFVVVGLAAIGYLSIQVGGVNYKGPGGLKLLAVFDNIGGLKPRAPVAISGVTVGQVVSIDLDPTSLRARVTLDVDPKLQLSSDTSAEILTSGLLGDQYIGLTSGAETDLLKSGDEIGETHSALSLERLIGKFVQNSGVEAK
jgi:phospholipid/cholesterol/gamma-HCH transport system substrate-binding protein